ncbi:MFS transporter [Microbacterium sp. NPDC089189]|uniref:MFS transporter n=1 Tax=Microbacterium sp. NPDC089189 TaxID=3154972 RepID=UPI003447C3EE
MTLPFAIFSFSLFWGAAQFIMLPIQVQALDPAHQDSALALVVGVGAVASMVSAPIAGAVTDRTRTRMGGREPWLIAAALATVVFSVLAGSAASISSLLLWIVALQVSTNFILTPVSAYIPDRVPIARRGAFSAAYGAAQLMGTVIGQIVGAQFGGAVFFGYMVVSIVLAALVITFALTNSQSNADVPRLPVRVRSILETFWVNPVRHPNFALAFAGRFLLFTGAYPVQIYLLFILQDYIGLEDGALAVVPVLSLFDLVGVLTGTVAAGILVQKLQRTRPLIYMAAGLISLGMLAPLISPTLESMIVCSLFSGLGLGIFLSVDLVLITLVLPAPDQAGKDLGIINITTTLPQTLGAVLGSIVIAGFGGYGALLPFAIAATLGGASLLAFIRGVR